MHATLADVIADTAQNSIEAGAKHVTLTLVEDGTTIAVTIKDDGKGMRGHAGARVQPVLHRGGQARQAQGRPRTADSQAALRVDGRRGEPHIAEGRGYGAALFLLRHAH